MDSLFTTHCPWSCWYYPVWICNLKTPMSVPLYPLQHLKGLPPRWKIPGYVLSHSSHVWLFATVWTVIHQAPQSIGFSRQECLWGAMPSSRESSQPRDGTCVSCLFCIAGGVFTAELLGTPRSKTYLIHEDTIGLVRVWVRVVLWLPGSFHGSVTMSLVFANEGGSRLVMN